jgi:L-threonylcarbamoyladenylate synthase
MKRVFTTDADWLHQAVSALTAGELVLFPTETSYGLGADATNGAAIEKLLAYKGNRLQKALSVAVADETMAADYVVMNPVADSLFRTLLPGPITVIAKSRGKVDSQVESKRGTLGIRYSSMPKVSELVRAFGKPITATSANTSGNKQLFSFDEWKKYIPLTRQKMVRVFIDHGLLPVRPPSTVVDTTLENPEVLRQGELVLSDGATRWISNSVEETIGLGMRLVEQQSDWLVTAPFIIALQGELGAGKTHFVKGVALALGISDTVASPTYTLLHEYAYKTKKSLGYLFHVDTWRLFEDEGVKELHLEPRIVPGTVVAIEWQQKAKNWIESLAKPIIIAWVDIRVRDEMCREIVIEYQRLD